MAAETPADENRVAKLKRVHDRPDGAGVAGQRIGAPVSCVVRGAISGQVDRNEPEALAERPVELP